MVDREGERAGALSWSGAVFWLTLAGLFLRLAAARSAVVISRDGIGYLEAATRLWAGDLGGALAHPYPPGFPALIAFVASVVGELGEGSAAFASALGASAVVPAVALLSARAYGKRAGLLGAALAATLPLLVELGGEVLADGWFVAVLAWMLVCAKRAQEGDEPAWAWAMGAGLLGGGAYLVRPEGLVATGAVVLGLVLAPRPAARAAPSSRWRAVAALALPTGLLVFAFVAAIRGSETLGGGDAGGLKLTLKQNMGHVLAALSPGVYLERFLDQGRYALKAALPGGLLAVGLLAARRVPPAARRLGWQLALVGLALWVVYPVFRADRRYGAALALLLLPHAAGGAVCLAGRLRRRWDGLRAPAAIALALTVLAVPLALRPRHAKKATYRQAGVLLAESGVRRVLAHDARASYYAGAEGVGAFHLPEGQRGQASVLAPLARERGADAIVVIVDRPEGQAASAELRDLLGVEPLPVAPSVDGGVALHVFLLDRRGRR
jgi:4-amino-4-deoxy-L-arabinose transferase-like glycosyltransferase